MEKKHNIKKNVAPLLKQLDLQLFVLPALIFTIIFCYIPMAGLQIAFKDYKLNLGIWASHWVGLKNFISFLSDVNLWPVFLNTITLSAIKTFLLFPLPIILAILLNEVKALNYRRFLQTFSYFPYFISWPIVALMANYWLAPDGFINNALVAVGILDEAYFFLGKPEAFYGISIALDIWKSLGYSTIIYLAAIGGVDHEQIEASIIDGANRFTRVIKIILPVLLPTIAVLFILNIGSMLSGGLYASNFQISYSLGNPLNQQTSQILDTYILKIGITDGRFAFATAIGLLNSLVCGILLVFGNYFSKKTIGESFF